MIRYEIHGSHGSWLLSEVRDLPDGTRQRIPHMFGSWLTCALALRHTYPKAKLRITQNLLLSNSVDRYLARNKA